MLQIVQQQKPFPSRRHHSFQKLASILLLGLLTGTPSRAVRFEHGQILDPIAYPLAAPTQVRIRALSDKGKTLEMSLVVHEMVEEGFQEFVPSLLERLTPFQANLETFGYLQRRVRASFKGRGTSYQLLLPERFPLAGKWEHLSESQHQRTLSTLVLKAPGLPDFEIRFPSYIIPYIPFCTQEAAPERYYFDGKENVARFYTREHVWYDSPLDQKRITKSFSHYGPIDSHRGWVPGYAEPFAFEGPLENLKGEYDFVRSLRDPEKYQGREEKSLIYSSGHENAIYLPYVTQELWAKGPQQVKFFIASYSEKTRLEFLPQACLNVREIPQGLYQLFAVQTDDCVRKEIWRRLGSTPLDIEVKVPTDTPVSIPGMHGVPSWQAAPTYQTICALEEEDIEEECISHPTTLHYALEPDHGRDPFHFFPQEAAVSPETCQSILEAYIAEYQRAAAIHSFVRIFPGLLQPDSFAVPPLLPEPQSHEEELLDVQEDPGQKLLLKSIRFKDRKRLLEAIKQGDATALQQLKNAVDSWAQNELGKLWRDGGVGIIQNLPYAKNLFRKAAQNGYVEAQVNLAALCERLGEQDEAFLWYGKAAGRKHEAALQWLRARAQTHDKSRYLLDHLHRAHQGDIAAFYTLALLHAPAHERPEPFFIEENPGVAMHEYPQEALWWLRCAAAHGHPEARLKLGELYEEGSKCYPRSPELNGLDKDKTVRLYRLAAWQASGAGPYKRLECLAINGNRVAINGLIQLANAGDAGALYRLGTFYENGNYVAQDLLKAARLYQHALGCLSDHSGFYATVAFAAGRLYENGHGISKNLAIALQQYIRAANIGHGEAKEKLWKFAERGYSEALRALEKLADPDEDSPLDPRALFYLGQLHEKGLSKRGFDHTANAYKYYEEAAMRGSIEAEACLENMAAQGYRKASKYFFSDQTDLRGLLIDKIRQGNLADIRKILKVFPQLSKQDQKAALLEAIQLTANGDRGYQEAGCFFDANLYDTEGPDWRAFRGFKIIKLLSTRVRGHPDFAAEQHTLRGEEAFKLRLESLPVRYPDPGYLIEFLQGPLQDREKLQTKAKIFVHVPTSNNPRDTENPLMGRYGNMLVLAQFFCGNTIARDLLETTFIQAVAQGEGSLRQWFLEKMEPPQKQRNALLRQAFQIAAEDGHVQALAWMTQHFSECVNGLVRQAFFGAARNGQLEMMEWMTENWGQQIDANTWEEALPHVTQSDKRYAVRGYLTKMISWQQPSEPSDKLIQQAFFQACPNRESMKAIVENYPDQIGNLATAALTKGAFMAWVWLAEAFPEEVFSEHSGAKEDQHAFMVSKQQGSAFALWFVDRYKIQLSASGKKQLIQRFARSKDYASILETLLTHFSQDIWPPCQQSIFIGAARQNNICFLNRFSARFFRNIGASTYVEAFSEALQENQMKAVLWLIEKTIIPETKGEMLKRILLLEGWRDKIHFPLAQHLSKSLRDCINKNMAKALLKEAFDIAQAQKRSSVAEEIQKHLETSELALVE